MNAPAAAPATTAVAVAQSLAVRCVEFEGGPDDAALALRTLTSALTVSSGPAHPRPVSEAAPGHASVALPLGGTAMVSVTPAAPGRWAATVTVTDPGSASDEDVDALLAVVDRLPLTGREVDQIRRDLPITGAVAALAGPGALEGLAVVAAIHHMRDFAGLLHALIECGADPAQMTIIDKGYPYRMRERVDGWLECQGVALVDYPQRALGIAAHLDRAKAAGMRTLVMDDGGYVLPVVLDRFPERPGEIVGVVEQTTSGIWRLADHHPLPVPVFSVAESQLKSAVEAPHVAAAALSSVMAHLPDETWAGRPALVIGYGRLGRQTAAQLRDTHRMRVAVHDLSAAALVTAHQDGHRVGRDLGALIAEHRPLLVMGCAGHGSLLAEHAAAFQASAYLASVTSRDHEFPLTGWARSARRVVDHEPVGHTYVMDDDVELCVLGDGLPVNFHHRESLPTRVIDLVFAALLLGGLTLAEPGQGGHGPGVNVPLVDQILGASPALATYLDLYAEEPSSLSAGSGAGGVRRLVTAAPDGLPDHTRSAWTYGRRPR
ncbi:hypothetical protein [Thermomonospora umbrina]|uniref:S-adenosylhomocysteine hydrolase n=1 Tax=Thermomonospora umbrina TaxID=111806 RepID=A0A3D9T7T6_9ACTN|nr:hypothetical protein [Thermomonospora umbrina]REF00745.1 S-adenosylhomocysteine hydrolase [Thermomonospora umbrina]